jgi:hypothetical protein
MNKMQQSKGSHPVKRPQSRQPNSSNIFELLEEQEEEQENPNTYLASFNGPIVKYQEEAESISPNIKGETSFGVSLMTPQEKES